jgi:hypothetical protein
MRPKESPHPMYRYYLCLVILAGLAATAYCGFQAFRQDLGYGWIILASLTALTGPFTIKIPGANSKISVAETFIITNLLLFGPAIGCITAGLDGLVGSLRCKTKSRRPQYALFNIAVMALSAFISGETYALFGGKPMVHLGRLLSLDHVWVPLGCLVLVYYLINTAAVAVIIGLERRQNIVRVWHKNFLWLGANYLTAGTTAGLLSLVVREVTPATIAVILTMLASSYMFCSSHFSRPDVKCAVE